jgi:hypothetical protein
MNLSPQDIQWGDLMLCTSRIHPLSLGNYLRIAFIIGNLVITGVTSVEWTWLGYLKLKGDYDFG